ncbi:DMT family transporter [Aerosakkonema sp. BLCC-F183]|uniref:DMT family transporter n=1 Tax=Aerosakkonema sp. BLCC-F183 TaxID=3342834 RepID=UPI0035BB5C29
MRLHQSSGNWRLGLALSLLTVFLWGILPIALAVTVQALDAYTLTWFRFLVAFALLGAYLAARQQLPPLEKLRRLPLQLLGIAVVYLAINYLLFLQGLAYTSPSHAEVLIQLAPVLMGLGGIFVFKERYTPRQWIGLSVLTLGLVLFFNEQLRVFIAEPTKYLLGSGMVVVGAITWAVYAMAQKQLLQKLPSSHIMLLIYGCCALVFTPATSPPQLLTLSPLHWGMLIFCALNTVFAYGAFAESLEHWEASKVSAVLALAPLVTLVSMSAVSLFFPNLVAPEKLTGLAVFGAILVVGGSIAIALGKSRK